MTSSGSGSHGGIIHTTGRLRWMDGWTDTGFLGRSGGSAVLPVREQLEYMELYLGMGQEPVDSL